jgi:hypothetical protein
MGTRDDKDYERQQDCTECEPKCHDPASRLNG